MHIIIPMSGIGKRFQDAGYNLPKPLIRVEGKPIIQHVVELFPRDETTKITFICNDFHLKTTKMREILETICPGSNTRIFSVSVENRRGPVDAVLQIKDYIMDDEEVIISYCDYGTQWDFSQFKNLIKENNVDGVIACYRGFHPHILGSDNYAFVKVEKPLVKVEKPLVKVEKEYSTMLEIQEKKPFTDNKMNEYASNGTYYFKKGSMVKKYFQELVDKNMATNGEFYVSMVYNLMVQAGLTIKVFEIEKMLQWGTPKDLEEYLVWSNYFLKRNPDFNKITNIKKTTLILPMAGAGSRFFNQGFTTPKPLLPIEGEPMVICAVESLPPFTDVHFICQESHLNQYPIAQSIYSKYPHASIHSIDHITEGQASTCELALKNIDLTAPLMISACDNGVYYDIAKYQELLDNDNIDIIIWSFSNNATSRLYPEMYAWLDVDDEDNGKIKRVSIKKPFTDVENKYAIIGTMLFKRGEYFETGLREIYERNLRTNGEFYVDNMIEPLIQLGYRCHIFNVDNYLCWGTPNDYNTYNYWFDYFSQKCV